MTATTGAAAPSSPTEPGPPAALVQRDAELAAVLLQLLRAEAPTEAFEQLLQDAERSLPEPRQRATLRSAVRLALEVRELLVVRTRRERELAALYETAGDLSSLRELQPVLEAIVRRAHDLLGCDATYLMLNDDERGRTYMRVTQGIRTDAFKGVELALGAGLGGLVAATGQAYATPDYVTDTRFVHTIDSVVEREGLVAILGVPLKLGDRVIGVCFAANRRPGAFGDDETELLASLAAHAAIAIENASLFAEVRHALADLRQANSLVRAHSESVERAAAMHERLTGLVVGGRGLPDVAQSVVEVLGAGLLVLDAEGRVLARAGEEVPDELAGTVAEGHLGTSALEEELRAVVSTPSRAQRTLRRELASGSSCAVAPVVAGAEVLGALVAVGRHLDDMELRSLERAALVAALLLLNERSVADAEQRVRGELFDDLLNRPERDELGLLRRAARLGVRLDSPHVVAVVRPRDEERRAPLTAAARRLAADEGGLAGEHGGALVLLLPGGQPGDVAREVRRRLSAATGLALTVGAAGPAAAAVPLASAHREAERCADVLVSLGRAGEAASPDDLGVYGLLFSQAGREGLAAFVQRTVGAVLEHDARRGSELTRTVLTYFELDGNLARTAAQLFVHVNTLYQRLDRVTSLLGEGWRHGDRALQVHLALKVHRALQPHADESG